MADSSHRWTSHRTPLLVAAFAAGGVTGGVAGWVARGATGGSRSHRATSYDDTDRTTYPPDAEDDAPPAVTDAEVHGTGTRPDQAMIER